MSANKELKMEKLTLKDGETPDFVQENIAGLRQLFPEVFIDGRIDFEVLKEMLGSYVEDKEERYSFTWHGKSRARRIAQTPSTGTLLPCKEESVNWDTTQNIFIEGDNLEVLKLLQKSYHRKVKMIYIDPPYNTGKEFIYPDKWQDNLDTYLRYTGQIDDEGFKTTTNAETSGRYHTNWLNMMYPRLKLARNLLRDDGVIFISIDFRESANLRSVMNELFGEENLVFEVSVVNNLKGRNDRVGIATCHESLLIYSKNEFTPRGLDLGEEKIADYDQVDANGRNFQWRDLRKRGGADTRVARPKMYFPLYVDPRNGRVSGESSPDFSVTVYPEKSDGEDGCWRWGKSKVFDAVDTLAAKKVAGKERWNIFYPVYLDTEDGQRRATPKSVWLDPRYSTDAATKALRKYFPGLPAGLFTPKPVALLRDIIAHSVGNGELVLDFFAGTGTLGEAMFEQDKDEGFRRRFIMVQLPEPCDSEAEWVKETGVWTASQMCCQRVVRYLNSATDADNGSRGFKLFKLSSSNIKPWDSDFQSIDADLFDALENIKPERSEHDVLYELILKYGLDLSVPVEERTLAGRTVFVIGAGALVVCLASSIDLDVVRGIADLVKELDPETCRVVFKDSGFTNDVVKTNAVQILKQAGVDDVKSL